MKALVLHDIGDIRLEEVRDPSIEEPDDAIVRITTSAICGTDLHFVRGTMGGMKKGTILGHEGVVDAYRAFDQREGGWIKVVLEPQTAAAAH